MEQITFVIGYLGLGGAERVISVLANEFAKMGKKVNIITLISDKVDYELDSRINYYNIKSNINNKFLKFIYKCIKLRKLIKELGDTKIISFLFIPILYTVISTLFLKNDIYVSERNNPYMEPRTAIKRIIRNISYYFADKVVFQTEDALRYFSKTIQKKGVVIPNPIKEDLPEIFLGERKKEIIAACRLDKQKNLIMLINACKMLFDDYSEYKLIIYGEGPLRGELQSYINDLKLSEKIILAGFSNEVHSKMRQAYMYVSSSDFEGISNSMLEALAMGVPSVVTDCPIGGARMVIKNNINGILVPVGDEERFYKGMKKIIENKELAKSISTEAIKIRNELNANRISKMWLNLL